MTPAKEIIQVFLVELVHRLLWRCRLLVLYLKILKKNPKCKISCAKNFISVHMKPFGHNKKFVTCKPPGDALNPYPRQNKSTRQGFPYLGDGGKSPSLTSYSFYTQVMLILILIDVQYLQNFVFLALKKVRMLEVPTTQ